MYDSSKKKVWLCCKEMGNKALLFVVTDKQVRFFKSVTLGSPVGTFMMATANFYQTIWYHAPHDENLHSYCYGNFTSLVVSQIFLCDMSANSKQLSTSQNSGVKMVKISPSI
jgi:hypothetical protein